MPASTTNYSFSLPTVGGDADNWGGYLNSNFTALDALLSGASVISGIEVEGAVSIDTDEIIARGGSLTGVSISGANASVMSLTIANSVRETIQTVTGQTPSINPNAGTIVAWTAPDNLASTPTITIDAAGKSFLLMLTLSATAGTASINWGSVVWINGTPTLEVNTTMAVTFWRVGTTTYGCEVGKT